MDRKDLKPTLLLALALFLISAPAPDADTVMEMTSNFIVPQQGTALQAADRESARTELANSKD